MKQLFYTTDIQNGFARLDAEESRHLLTVLRRQAGDHLQLTDGRGFFYEAEIVEVAKTHTLARILETKQMPEPPARLHIAIALIKQMERFEWFLEKAAEIGIQEITPLLCERSQRRALRHERLEKILISAMKQCLQSRLPRLRPLTPFTDLVRQAREPQRFIPWCSETPLPMLGSLIRPATDTLVLIGPEGDFTPEEVELALSCGFTAASLGTARLRTETAGLVALMHFHLSA